MTIQLENDVPSPTSSSISTPLSVSPNSGFLMFEGPMEMDHLRLQETNSPSISLSKSGSLSKNGSGNSNSISLSKSGGESRKRHLHHHHHHHQQQHQASAGAAISVLDDILTAPLSPTPTSEKSMKRQGSSIAVAEDGFLDPEATTLLLQQQAAAAASPSSSTSSSTPPQATAAGHDLLSLGPSPGRPPSLGKKTSSSSHARRMSTGGLPSFPKTPLTLEGLRQRLSRAGSVSNKIGEGVGGVVQAARRFGLDITGLRKALLIRVLGVEMVKNSIPKPPSHRRTSSGGIPSVSWMKKRSNHTEESLFVILWVLDVESGQEWRMKKTPQDFTALYDVISVLRPGFSGEDFPFKRSKIMLESSPTSASSIGPEKQARLERYLRKIAFAMDLSPSTASFEVAKTLQDFIGATERADILTDIQHRDENQLRQLLQVYSCDLLRQPQFEKRLQDFVDDVQRCDVARTDLLRGFNLFVGQVAREVMEKHGDRLRGVAEMAMRGMAEIERQAPRGPDEVEQVCVSCLRRVIEAETFVPLMGRIYERVVIETDGDQEKQLQAKFVVFKSLPQTFFGIPVSQISVSSWETAVQHLKRLGESTTLPSDKLDVLVAAVREVHILYRREHPEATKTLGADESLPIFIYVVSQSGVPRLLALKNMLASLCDPARLLSEPGYCLATLEAAIDYLLRLDEHADNS